MEEDGLVEGEGGALKNTAAAMGEWMVHDLSFLLSLSLSHPHIFCFFVIILILFTPFTQQYKTALVPGVKG